MKKHYASMSFACTLIGTSAFAQSSVLLYGGLDAGLTHVSNTGGSQAYLFDDGISYGNRFGLTGIESLDGDEQAIFKLESGFRLGTGQINPSGALLDRQVYVGLSNPWGKLTLGKQYDFAFDFTSAYSASGFASGYGIHQGDFDRQSGDQLPNSLKFVSNGFHGLVAGGMYAFSNGAGDFHNGSSWSVGLSDKIGSFSGGGNYTRLNSPMGLAGLDPYAQIGVTSMLGQNVASVNPGTGSVTDLYASSPFHVDSQAIFGIGASYAFAKLTVMGDFSNTVFNGYGRVSTMRVLETGMQYRLSASLSLVDGYQYTTFEDHHWHQGALGAHYALSKRTDIYAAIDWLRASSGVDAVIGYSFTPSSSGTQTATRVGMRHTF